MDNLVELSKRLTNHLLQGKSEKLGKEYFFVFSISKFILLKELILKKEIIHNPGSGDSTKLYFDNVKNAKYIPVILDLYNYIIQYNI